MDRRRLTHQEAVDDLPAFVLGALDGDEAEAISAHVATCTSCQIERDRLEQTLGLVGMTVEPVEAPAGLRGRILGQLGDAEPVEAPAGLRGRILGQLGDEEPFEAPVTMIPQRSVIRRLSQFGFAAAAVLLVGVLAWGILMQHDLNSTQDSLNSAEARQATNAELLANVVQTIPMVADSSPNAYGTLYIGSQTNRALLVVEQLPPTPSNKMYQVWLNSGSTRVSAGLFSVDSSGSAMVMIAAPQPLSTYQSLGITSEPAPKGSTTPTGSRVIGCSLH